MEMESPQQAYGSVERRGGAWLIRCEPHVRNRLRRVFPQVTQSASEVITLSDTAEHARELEWFLQRFPMTVTDSEYLASRSAQHLDTEHRIRELLLNRAEIPSVTLAKPPREYQELVPYALSLRGGLLLADDVGVGKTVSALACIAPQGGAPALIVVPPHLIRHWEEKLTEFLPNLSRHTIRKGTPYPLVKQGRRGYPDLRPDRPPDVLICTYHRLRSWAETLKDTVNLIIYEEVHQLRNNTSKIYAACELLSYSTARRIGLSATPAWNYGAEYYWVINALVPGALGTREEFGREWCDGEFIKDTTAFSAYLRREGLMLRRTRKDVQRELPPVQTLPHWIDADLEVLKTMEGKAADLAKVILAHNENFRGQKRQASSDFDMLMRQATGIAKAPYVAEFVRLLVDSGESVVLFGWHRAVYDIWMERLGDLKPALYTGSESTSQKAEAERRFKEGETKVLIMSLRSGSGVDGLQYVSRTSVIGELDWSPGVLTQCVGRVDRDGQPDPTTAYYLLSEHGADPVMADILGLKRAQGEGILNPNADPLEAHQVDGERIRRLAHAYLASVRAAAAGTQATSISEDETEDAVSFLASETSMPSYLFRQA